MDFELYKWSKKINLVPNANYVKIYFAKQINQPFIHENMNKLTFYSTYCKLS